MAHARRLGCKAKRKLGCSLAAVEEKIPFRAAANKSTPDFDLYNLCYRWAMRSIEAKINQSLCAKAMGHTLKEHEQTYQRELQGQTLRAAMAKLAEAR